MKQDRDVPDTVRRATRLYVDNRAALDRAWAALPPTLLHGDCHLGNTYRRPDGSAGIYDWQNLHRMNGLRDFAYLLTASVPTALRQKAERDLLARYLGTLADAGAGAETPTADAAFDTYRLLAIDGWISAFATAAIGGMQDDVIETSLQRAMQTLVDLDTEAALRAAI
jgi:aminoglycoside phosphotransferase (APT) family kinase protein